MKSKRPALGRGLDKLLSSSAQFALSSESSQSAENNGAPKEGELRHIPLEALQPGPYQPRQSIGKEALEELAHSIREQGVMQPIVVRPLPQERFEIIAGERRWRAAQLAKLSTIPVIVRDVGDEGVMAMALIENIQRENLNPIEEAMALQRLIKDFSLSHEEVAKAVGKYRPTITNLLRLLNLREEVKQLLMEGALTQGHGRVLVGLEETLQSKIAHMIVEKQWSVRQTESYVRQLQKAAKTANGEKPKETSIGDYKAFQEKLTHSLALPVTIKANNKGKGAVEIRFTSEKELKGLLDQLLLLSEE